MKYGIDDMDELFRRAAEGYPLDVNSTDWDKVANALHSSNEQGKNKSTFSLRRLLWLLMLLPLPFICNHTDWGKPNRETGVTKTGPGDDISSVANRVVSKVHANQSLQNDGSATFKEVRPPLHEPNSLTVASAPSTYKTAGPSAATRPYRKQTQAFALYRVNRPAKQKEGHKTSTETAAVSAMAMPQQETSVGKQLDRPLRGAFMLLFNAKEAAVRKTVTETIQPAKSALKGKARKQLYSGLVGNFGWSSVKSQWAHQPDNSLGILIGLQWNSRWAIEAGVNLDKKYYLSDGKYFKGPNPWPNASIKSLDGNCFMFEIPLDIRFNVFNRKGSSWFITNGISSYLMKKESYTYIVAYGAGATAEHYYDYKNASQNWLAIYQVSVGYERVLGKFGSIRAEPFAKIPLTGLGVGKLPFVSTGLQVGLIHRF